MEEIVQILKALSDETRLKILIILTKRNICAKGIAKHLDISEASVSQHIKILKDAGIIVGEKQGYFVHYHLQKSALKETADFIEKIGNNHNLDFNVPIDCKSTCRANNKKCCKNI